MPELVFPTGSTSMAQLWRKLDQNEKNLLSDIIDIETMIQVKKKDSQNTTEEEALRAALQETRAENAKLLQTLTEKEEANQGLESELKALTHRENILEQHRNMATKRAEDLFMAVGDLTKNVEGLVAEKFYQERKQESLLEAQAALKSQMEEMKTTNKNLTNQLAVTDFAVSVEASNLLKRKRSLDECGKKLQQERDQKIRCLQDERKRKDLERTLEDALRQQSEKLCQDCRGGSEVKYGRRGNRNVGIGIHKKESGIHPT